MLKHLTFFFLFCLHRPQAAASLNQIKNRFNYFWLKIVKIYIMFFIYNIKTREKGDTNMLNYKSIPITRDLSDYIEML
jgi:hypothetical protein